MLNVAQSLVSCGWQGRPCSSQAGELWVASGGHHRVVLALCNHLHPIMYQTSRSTIHRLRCVHGNDLFASQLWIVGEMSGVGEILYKKEVRQVEEVY